MKDRTQLILWGSFGALCWASKKFDWFHDTRAWLDAPAPTLMVVGACVIMGGCFVVIERKIDRLLNEVQGLRYDIEHRQEPKEPEASFLRRT